MHERPSRPTAAEFLAAFDQTIYGVVAPTPVVRNLNSGPGWGRSGTTISHLRLSYRVGRQRDEVEVDVTNKPHRASPAIVIHQLLFQGLFPLIDDSTEFPLDLRVERVDAVIQVERSEHRFSGFAFASRMALIGEVDGLEVTLTGPRQLVPRVRLGRLDPERFKRWLDASDRKRTRRRLSPEE